jgi:hypothetical protein
MRTGIGRRTTSTARKPRVTRSSTSSPISRRAGPDHQRGFESRPQRDWLARAKRAREQRERRRARRQAHGQDARKRKRSLRTGTKRNETAVQNAFCLLDG